MFSNRIMAKTVTISRLQRQQNLSVIPHVDHQPVPEKLVNSNSFTRG